MSHLGQPLPPVSPASPPETAPATTAIVVFRGQTDLWWLRWLRPGFRHCLIVLHDQRHWVLLDPLSSHTDIRVLSVAPDFDVARWFTERGMITVTVPLPAPARRPAPWSPFTCVEAVKRVLGLHDPWVLTPWQLYRRLAPQDHAGVASAA